MAEVRVSRDAQYRGRPTIRVDETENPRLASHILGFRVTEREGGLSSLELRLLNFSRPEDGGDEELAFEDERDIKLGSRIKLYSGDARTPREIFRGVVTGLEAEFPQSGPPELLVLGEDALQLARMKRRTKVHDALKLRDLAREVAQQASLRPVVTGLGDDLGTHVQLNESDLAFLRRLLVRYDGDVQVVGDELHVSTRNQVRRGEIELALRSQLLSARFVADLADQVTETTTSGWNARTGMRVRGSSRGANFAPGGGRLAARILPDALVARAEHVSSPAVVPDQEASALADAVFDRRARRFVRLEGVADGNPLIRVGTHLRITGTSRRWNNTYYVVCACHRYDTRRGYETDFEAECAYLGNPNS
jgi:uncharacterized protein